MAKRLLLNVDNGLCVAHNLGMTRSYRPPPTLGEEETATTEEPAVAARAPRKGLAREERDLFVESDDAGETFNAPRTGERSENSVLFSLDTLKKQADSVRPPDVRPAGVPQAPHEKDSTGTIDLREISKLTGGTLQYKPLDLSEPVMSAYAEPEKARSGGLKPWHLAVMGGGGAALVLALAGVVFALRGSPPAVARTPDLVRAPMLEAAAPRLRGKIEDAAPAAVVAVGGHGPAHRATGVRTTSSPAPKPAAPKPSVDKCGCHGVLSCVIRCAATGK